MDILQLRYFFDSANYLSISKTAEKYRVPPTSVSASIKRLEGDIGCRLFDRHPNRITLTEKGQLMRDHLKIIFDEMDEMMDSVGKAADDNKEIKISARAARTMLTDCIINYKNRYSNTRFFLDTDFEDTPADNYDIIIDQKSEKYKDYDSIIIKKSPLYIFAADKTGLPARKLKLKDLQNEFFVVTSRRGNHAKAMVAACEKAGFSPNITAQINDSACFRKIIASGIALGVSAPLPGDSELSISKLNITDFKCEQEIRAYYKPKNLYGNTARFIAFLSDYINSNKNI